MESILKTKELSKWYGSVIGVNEIDWEFNGGIVGLLGSNGAGKSTFLKLITGQLKPTKGSVKVFGQKSFASSQIFQKVGFAPEQDLGNLYLSALKFLTITGNLYGYSRKKAVNKAEEAIDQVQMSGFKNRPMNTYSKGMRQRIKIARSILHSPLLLVLDEPLTGTDPVGRKILLDFFSRYASKEENHIILSSHVLHEVESITDQILLINKGRVRAGGSVSEIRQLMNEFPHRIRFKMENPRSLASELILEDSVQGVSFDLDGQTMYVEAREPEKFYQTISSLVVKTKSEVTEIFSENDNLESVFKYLIE